MALIDFDDWSEASYSVGYSEIKCFEGYELRLLIDDTRPFSAYERAAMMKQVY